MTAISRDDTYPRVTISLLKRHLLEEMSPETRKQFVGSLERWAADLGADVVEAIKPMCDKGYAILSEVGASGAVDSFNERFHEFAALNPSLKFNNTARRTLQ
ncbi:hypothetical protein [Bradyrhizobium sp. dw_411]|uniref:hypothetical protein n=1 Tax=Bradyrhizobium sp. dw_411 TaxID=2720082 RepID=UPI001BCD1934|nr:hypothetical protein [Bradyrhizobium sp. dw_411]